MSPAPIDKYKCEIVMPPKGLVRRICDKIRSKLSTPMTRSANRTAKPLLEQRIESIEQQPENEPEIIAKLLASYTEAIEQQALAPAPYWPGANWKSLLETEWQVYRDAITRQDGSSLAQLLRGFFRN